MSTDLARRFRVDVSTDGTTWVQLGGVNDFNPQVNNTDQDASTYDNNGWTSTERTAKTWAATVKAFVVRSAGVLDAGLNLAYSAQLQFGSQARLYARWYDRTTGQEGRTGLALIEWNRSKTGFSDLDEVTISFKGDGQLNTLATVTVTTPVPSILTATPSGVAAGGQVQITGQYFTSTVATTGVKFGGTNATSWIVVSDSQIVAVMPAGTAGAANITVTNATGASNAFNYTRG